MHQQFHPRDWTALINKVLRDTGHQRIQIKKVLAVHDNAISFLTCQGAKIIAPTFNSIHGHGIGFLSLLRVANSEHLATWDVDSGEPLHHCQLIVRNNHNFTPMLYPSLGYVKHWLAKQYGEDGESHIAPFEDDVKRGFIGDNPALVDIQRQLSYPIV